MVFPSISLFFHTITGNKLQCVDDLKPLKGLAIRDICLSNNPLSQFEGADAQRDRERFISSITLMFPLLRYLDGAPGFYLSLFFSF